MNYQTNLLEEIFTETFPSYETFSDSTGEFWGYESWQGEVSPAPQTRLVLINRATNEAALRRAFIANAYSLNGLESANPNHRATWLEILGPITGKWDLDRPFKVSKDPSGKYRTQGVSTCGLVAEGIWRRMKVDLPSLYQPYKFGSAINRALEYARKLGAWITPAGGSRPAPGDYVIIGTGLKTHALTCVGWDGDMLISIDGGQAGERGLQAIKERRRRWYRGSGGYMLEDRIVNGWVNIAKLRYRNEPIYVPQGFRL